MDLFPVPGSLPPDPVGAGWARVIRHGPQTVAQVLERARAEMDDQDERERQAADPLLWARAHRPRTLLDRLLHGRR
jgi:hypothetical protein